VRRAAESDKRHETGSQRQPRVPLAFFELQTPSEGIQEQSFAPAGCYLGTCCRRSSRPSRSCICRRTGIFYLLGAADKHNHRRRRKHRYHHNHGDSTLARRFDCAASAVATTRPLVPDKSHFQPQPAPVVLPGTEAACIKTLDTAELDTAHSPC
jgi:hypothetical protein